MNVRVAKFFGFLGGCFLITTTACSGEGKVSAYDRLCTIYEEVLAGTGEPRPATFQRLADRVDDEAPEISEHFGHLVNLPREDFYSTLKTLAKSEGEEAWECTFIETYYSGA